MAASSEWQPRAALVEQLGALVGGRLILRDLDLTAAPGGEPMRPRRRREWRSGGARRRIVSAPNASPRRPLSPSSLLAAGCGGDDDGEPGRTVTVDAGGKLAVEAREYSFDPERDRGRAAPGRCDRARERRRPRAQPAPTTRRQGRRRHPELPGRPHASPRAWTWSRAPTSCSARSATTPSSG